MKIHKSTRLLALFLSALMVVVSFPLAAFAQSANVSNLESAVSAFETKFSETNGKLYTNIGDAYGKYITAKKLLDTIKYGGADGNQIDVDNAATALNTAVKNMQAYTAPTVNANAYPTWSDGSNRYKDQSSHNILYAGPEYSSGSAVGSFNGMYDYSGLNDQTTGDDQRNNFITNYYYGTTVLYYDGNSQNPQFPVMFSFDIRKNLFSAGYSLDSVYPSNGNSASINSNFTIYHPLNKNSKWSGGGSSKSYDAAVGNNSKTPAGYYVTESYSGTCQTNKINDPNISYYSSSILCKAIPTNYVERYKLTWYAFGEIEFYDWGWKYVLLKKNSDSSVYTYLVNGPKLKERQTEGVNKFASIYKQSKNIADFGMNNTTLQNVFNQIDYVTSFNPSASGLWNNTDSAYNDINSKMAAADTALNSTISLDASSAYQTLRNQIDAVRATYEAGNTNYTTTSWNNFVQAYKNAQSFFPANNTYNRASETATTATALNNAKAALDPLANFTALDTAISKIKAIADNKYTAQSVNEAKTAYEKALADYKMENASKTETGTLNKDNQTKINDEAAAIEEALKKLVEYDDSTYEAVKEKQKAAVDNTDMFDVAKLSKILEDLNIDNCKINVAFTGKENDVVAYDTDAYIRAILNALSESTFRYTVTVDGSDEPIVYDGRTEFTYGETVKVGEAEYNSKVKPGRTATWMEPVYIGSTDKIVVRGDTVLTKCTGTGENVKVVKFVSGGQVYDIQSTTESPFDLSKANIYAPSHYTVSGYKVGDETYDVNGQLPLNETGTTEVTVLFKADTKLGEVTVNGKTHTFGAKVTLKSKEGNEVGFYANGDHLWNGNSYTFYARETVTIEEGEFSTVVGAHTSKIEPSNGKVYFYGGISNADESNVLSQGMIIELDGEETKELTLAAVDGEHIFNVTAQRIDSVTKQYSISMPENAASKVRCRAYVAYKTTDGIKYVYSNATQVYPAPSDEVTA